MEVYFCPATLSLSLHLLSISEYMYSVYSGVYNVYIHRSEHTFHTRAHDKNSPFSGEHTPYISVKWIERLTFYSLMDCIQSICAERVWNVCAFNEKTKHPSEMMLR